MWHGIAKLCIVEARTCNLLGIACNTYRHFEELISIWILACLACHFQHVQAAFQQT